MESSYPQVRWRLLLSPPMDGPANMALDHALMERARASREAVLRVYSWTSPVLSLGRNQPARSVYRDHELSRRGIAVVRRPTGGRALLHHREVTYSVTAPDTSIGLTESYRRFTMLVINALKRMGVSAELAQPVGRAATPTGRPCFAEPARGEVVVNGRKLVGSAQWRHEGALLQHGSIIVDDDQSTIAALMRTPIAAPAPATLRELLGRSPSPQEVAGAVFDGVRSSEDPEASILDHSELDRLHLDIQRLRTVYEDPSWTWRR